MTPQQMIIILPFSILSFVSPQSRRPTTMYFWDCALTVVHMLLECLHYSIVRQRYFSVATLKDLFETINTHTILDFIKEIVFYNHISLSLFNSVLQQISFLSNNLTSNCYLSFFTIYSLTTNSATSQYFHPKSTWLGTVYGTVLRTCVIGAGLVVCS